MAPREGKNKFKAAQVQKKLKHVWEEMALRLEDMVVALGCGHLEQKPFNVVGGRSRPRPPFTTAKEGLR